MIRTNSSSCEPVTGVRGLLCLWWRGVMGGNMQETYRLIVLLNGYCTAVALEALAARVELSEGGRRHALCRFGGGL